MIVNHMVNYSGAALDATFQALADPTRRAILAKLASAPDTPVTELAQPFRISLPAVSRHLRVLESAGLLARRREGRVHRCRFVPGPMRTVSDWISHYERFWIERLEALKQYLETSPKEEAWPHPPEKPGRRKSSASRARSGRRGRASSARGRIPSS